MISNLYYFLSSPLLLHYFVSHDKRVSPSSKSSQQSSKWNFPLIWSFHNSSYSRSNCPSLHQEFGEAIVEAIIIRIDGIHNVDCRMKRAVESGRGSQRRIIAGNVMSNLRSGKVNHITTFLHIVLLFFSSIGFQYVRSEMIWAIPLDGRMEKVHCLF